MYYQLLYRLLLPLLAEAAVMGNEQMRTSFCEKAQPRHCGGLLEWVGLVE